MKDQKQKRNRKKHLLTLLLLLSLAAGSVPAAAFDSGAGDADFAADVSWAEYTSEEDTENQPDIFDPAEAEDSFEMAEEPAYAEEISADDPAEAAGGKDTAGADDAEEKASLKLFDPEDTDFSSEETEDSGDDPDIRYIKGRPLSEEEIARQMAMEKIGPSMIAPQDVESDLYGTGMARAFAASLPEKYDVRPSGWITSVKDQGRGLGICWAFSLASLMETSLLKQGFGTYDLSEEHLAYFLYNHVNDPLGNTPKDRTTNVDTYHDGGNGIMGISHLSTWSGMTTEEDVPMPDELFTVVPDDSKAYHAVAYLKNANVSGYAVTRTKNLITAYSSVGTLLFYSPAYMAWDTAAYACPKGYDPAGNDKSINHMVTLVGWDDTYSAKNFSSASGITSDGAWIAKNSWGDQWGEDGYFYISYQDASLSGLVTVEAMIAPEYPNNYFYDGTALNRYISLKYGESVANVFSVKAAGTKAEVLGEVNVFTYNDNAKYTVKIYTNLKDAASPSSGTLAATLNCQQSYAGIRTLKVADVTLLPGTHYAVVVTNANPSGTLRLAAECDQDASWVSSFADVQYGQSFYSAADLKNWKDWADQLTYAEKEQSGTEVALCIRLKAHTKNTDQVPAYALSSDSLTLEMGNTAELSASVSPASPGGNYSSFTSSDPGIVKVEKTNDHTVRLTAVRPGKATITCKSVLLPKLTHTCKVTVTYTAPAGLKATSAGYDRVKVSWTAAAAAPVSGYQVFRLSADEAEKKIATVTSGCTCTDKSLLTGKKYSYRIRAYTKLSDGKIVYSDRTAYVSAVPELAVPTGTARAGSTYNTVTWSKVTGAQGYYVYRRITGQKWKRVKTINKAATVSWKDSGASALTGYEYAVRAYRVVSGKTVLSAFQASNTVITAPAKQKIKTASSVSNGIKLVWTPQKKASGYRIYRRTEKGSWVRLKDLSGGSVSSYTDKSAKKNTTYYYAVKAFVKEPYGGRAYGSYTAQKAVKK